MMNALRGFAEFCGFTGDDPMYREPMAPPRQKTLVEVRRSPRLSLDGDGDRDYWCPKCQPPAIAGGGRRCPTKAPKIEYRTDGAREWFAVTCGVCGYHDDDPGDEPVYEFR
jgi:hypothetical protein